MESLLHFGFSSDPFEVEPDLGFYVEGVSRGRVRERVLRGLCHKKGLTVMHGESGTGKTLLTRKILGELDGDRFEAVLMVLLAGTSDATDVLKRYARELGVKDPRSNRAELLSQLYGALCEIREAGRHALLILDDAQILGADALEALASLMGLEFEGRRLLSVLLVGDTALCERLLSESALAQRVDVLVGLEPLSFSDLGPYLEFRIGQVGGRPGAIPEAVLPSLFDHSGGRPRAINTIVDNALFEAFLAGRSQLDVVDIEQAVGDLRMEGPTAESPAEVTGMNEANWGDAGGSGLLDSSSHPLSGSRHDHPLGKGSLPAVGQGHDRPGDCFDLQDGDVSTSVAGDWSFVDDDVLDLGEPVVESGFEPLGD